MFDVPQLVTGIREQKSKQKSELREADEETRAETPELEFASKSGLKESKFERQSKSYFAVDSKG
jgi:hypothetical protein